METIVLNGARAGDAKVDEVCNALSSLLGTHATVFKLREIPIADCLGCFGCWIKTPGECVINDAAKDIAKKLQQSDLKIFVSPVVFGGYSYELKKALDRQVCSELLPFFMTVKGEVHHKPRYEKHANIIVIGVLPKPDLESESIFKTLVSHNAVNMNASSYSVGFVYSEDSDMEIHEKLKMLFGEVGIKNE